MECFHRMPRQRREISPSSSSSLIQQARLLTSPPSSDSLLPTGSLSWSLAQMALTRDDQQSTRSDALSQLETQSSSFRKGFFQQKSTSSGRHTQHKTGLPEHLKTGIERLSGLSLDDVQVHYNSSKPAQVDALAYTQGRDIYMGPGQEKHLAHEAWHSVQQKLQQVKPTTQIRELAINDNAHLEREADRMGKQAEQISQSGYSLSQAQFPMPPGAMRGSILNQPGSLPVSATPLQPVAQLMKLSELDITGLRAGEGSTKPMRVFNGSDYHVTIYIKQSTYDKYAASLPKKNGKPDFGQLSDDQFEFDEFHITPGKEHGREHFFYDEQGRPLLQSIETNTPSSAPNDARWKEYNKIIARLLKKDVYEINKAFNYVFGGSRLPASAQEEQRRESSTHLLPASMRKKQLLQASRQPLKTSSLEPVSGPEATSTQEVKPEKIFPTLPATSEKGQSISTEQTFSTLPVSSEEDQPVSIPPTTPRFNFQSFSLDIPKKDSAKKRKLNQPKK